MVFSFLALGCMAWGLAFLRDIPHLHLHKGFEWDGTLYILLINTR